MVTRIISGTVIAALVLLFGILGGPALMLAVAVISFIGMFELYRVFQIEKKLPGYAGYLGLIAMDLVIWLKKDEWILPVLVLVFLLILACYVLTYPKYRTEEILPAFFGLFYVGLMLSFIYRTRENADGLYNVWLIFISAFGCDTCAYFTGMAFGKHKMAPVLSPKKSVEGAVGGVAGTVILCLLFAFLFREHLTEFSSPYLACGLIGLFGSLISMIGDLTASAIKRNYKIKDYGTLIPGHGGIMDRFDSIIFTAPVIFYLTTLLQKLHG